MRWPENHSSARGRGFTLIELLVVIGIIVLLAAILMPVIGYVRIAAQKADTQNQIQGLAAAIKQYHDSFHAYPGPLDDAQIYTPGAPGIPPLPAGIGNGQVTMAENMFLGLVGGLTRPAAQTILFQPPSQATGIGNLSAVSATPYNSIIKDWAGQVSAGKFQDNLGQYAADSNVPEFLDRFTDHRMPILYLRAKPGRRGVMSDGTLPFEQYQYDLRQISPYTSARLYGQAQGLRSLGNYLGPLLSKGVNYDALPYFRSQTEPGQNNANGNPRVKDTYILISAGADGIYGTADDITSFGDVIP
jgi:prepilin-type N-terminal cleavage/methylation domain-containing protein